MGDLNDIHISDDDSNDGIDECQRDLTPDLDGGILKQIVQGGKYKSKPFLNDDVLIHVVGTLKKENKVFYNTRKLEKPWKTQLESPELPKALNIALRTMKRHEIAILTCKPEYCYKDEPFKGDDFICEVPANSDIVFEVELLDYRFYDLTKEKQSGVMFMRRFQKGTGDFYPTYGSEVCCDISSYDDYKFTQTYRSFGSFLDLGECSMTGLNNSRDDEDYEDDHYVDEFNDGLGKVAQVYQMKDRTREMFIELKRDRNYKYIERRDYTWTLGDGELEQLPKGVEIAVENMVVGEKAMFMVRYDFLKEMLSDEEYARYKKNSKFYCIIITLKSCKRAKEYYEMTREERIEEGLECKLKGNHYLTVRSNVKLALKRFKRAIDLLETSIDLDGDSSERDALLFSCYLNISKAYFEARTPELCADYVEKALKMRPTDEKAMYRRGLLLIERKQYAEARTQFEQLLVHYPSNKAAMRLKNECGVKLIEQVALERDLYKTMSKALIN